MPAYLIYCIDGYVNIKITVTFELYGHSISSISIRCLQNKGVSSEIFSYSFFLVKRNTCVDTQYCSTLQADPFHTPLS